jgi:PilZ domain
MDLSNTPQFNDDGSELKRERHRESMFLLATVRFSDGKAPISARVRNISSGGMMIDSGIEYAKGHRVLVELKNVGEVGGYVAWSTATRMGIAFDNQIDPKLARQSNVKSPPVPLYAKSVVGRRPGLTTR